VTTIPDGEAPIGPAVRRGSELLQTLALGGILVDAAGGRGTPVLSGATTLGVAAVGRARRWGGPQGWRLRVVERAEVFQRFAGVAAENGFTGQPEERSEDRASWPACELADPDHLDPASTRGRARS